jgi:hypothetical protein
VRFSAAISVISGALLVGGCSLPDVDSFRAPDASNLFRKLSVTSSYTEKVLPPVQAADMVDSSGRCAGAYVPPQGGDQPTSGDVTLRDAGVPLIPAGIGLDMTECDVVKRAGVADRVEIGANDRRERTATLTYLHGDKPGIYRFTDGRLKSMEMAPEPPAPPKVAKKKPAKPPARRASQPNTVSVQ